MTEYKQYNLYTQPQIILEIETTDRYGEKYIYKKPRKMKGQWGFACLDIVDDISVLDATKFNKNVK